MMDILFENMKGEIYLKEVGYFLLKDFPHFFLNIGEVDEFFGVKHGNIRDIVDELLLTLMIKLVLLHRNPLLGLGLLLRTYLEVLSFLVEVDIGICGHI